MSEVSRATDDLLIAIRQAEAFINFNLEKKKMQEEPELKMQVDQFRMRNFELQTAEDSENLFEAISDFEREYTQFLENPKVSQFLAAEVELCRMIQEVYAKITEAVEID